MSEQLADLESHRIEGFTNEGGIQFSVPLYTQVGINLWMGGRPPPEGAPQFNTIVCLYPWEHYKIYPGQIQTSVFMFDGRDVPDRSLLTQLLATIDAAVERGPTPIHCQAGLNRSGLLTALHLIDAGMMPSTAIAMLREKRSPAVLCNKAFEAYLLSLGGE